MKKLSVVISAFNEEKRIGESLDSVAFADEIIVVDNSSSDKTAAIAKKHKAKVFERENNPMLNVNKNYGFTKASSDWILCLDADEKVTKELQEEIIAILKKENEDVNGYWIPRKNIIFGKWIEHTGWYPDHQLRLFKKGKGKFPELHVHEMVEVEGQTEKLGHHIIHENYESIAQFLQKVFVLYARNEADVLLEKGYSFNWLDAIRFPAREFLRRFFAQEGYKDGFHGLMLSIAMAFYHFIIFSFIWEKRGFEEFDDNNFLKKVQREISEQKKEFKFWFVHEAIKNTNSPIKKSLLRIKRKIS